MARACAAGKTAIVDTLARTDSAAGGSVNLFPSEVPAMAADRRSADRTTRAGFGLAREAFQAAGRSAGGLR